jgi:two-component system, OmpR family, KDP operon response regulator KdpE
LRVNLESAGYHFTGVSSGDEALEALSRLAVDIVLLDVRMSKMDGFALLDALREFSDVPVIFVTARAEEADKVRGLKSGADDYLTKPFGAHELLARVEAVLRRYHGSPGLTEVTVGSLRIDLAQRRIFRGNEEILLSRTEFRLLACLIRHIGKVVPQDQLVREVWGQFYEEGYEGLRVYIYRLRQKLEADPEQPEFLITFPGVGYMLQVPAASAAR